MLHMHDILLHVVFSGFLLLETTLIDPTECHQNKDSNLFALKAQRRVAKV